MDWDARRDGRALQRIVTLLLALSNLAERSAALPFGRRAAVLAILRHAEAAAWAFALGTPFVSTASGRDRREPQNATPPGAPAGDHDCPADAARLAFSLRLLALIVAGWASKTLSSTGVPLPARRAMALNRPGSIESWRGLAALPAPDTS